MSSSPISGDRQDLKPVPDPTLLTTQQLLRENLWLREVIETRLDGMDKAIQLLQAASDKFPERIDEKISALQGVQDERFRSIDKQFVERDVRTEQNATQTKVAVDAALQAAEKAVGKQQEAFSLATDKQEASVTKQIDAIVKLIETNFNALLIQLNDQKERITRIESKGEGVQVAQTTHQTSVRDIVGIIAVILSAIAIAIVYAKH